MGVSNSKKKVDIEAACTLASEGGMNGTDSVNTVDEAPDSTPPQERCRSCTNESQSEKSFVFVDHPSKEWSSSVSSAEDAVLWDNHNSFAKVTTGSDEVPSQDNVNKEVPADDQIVECSGEVKPCSENLEKSNHVAPQSLEAALSSQSHQDSDPAKEDADSRSNQTLLRNNDQYSANIGGIATEDGRQQWLKINGSSLTLTGIYEILSFYGYISALAETTDGFFVKFTSWKAAVTVLNDAMDLKHRYNFDSIEVVGDEIMRNNPGRREIYLGLPSFVLAYLKSHTELSKLMHMVTVTANDNFCFITPKMLQMCDFIRIRISKEYPQCRLFPFGSHILGNYDGSLPLEIFVDIGDMYAGCHKQSCEDQINISKAIRKLLSEDVTWYSLEESSIGVFFHEKIGLKCILSYNNGLGDRSTRLLRVFMNYDERFRVLYLTLDAWCRQCSLHGLNGYILASLLVFYLQGLPVPLLPSIQRIRTGRPVIVKGWDCTMTEDESMLPRTECTMDLHSLLRGFFAFYSNYDWERVVCPVLGQSVDRNLFAKPSIPFPEDPALGNYCRAIYEKRPNTADFDVSTCMCVQDFFNLSENISKGVSPDALLRFRSLCRQSHRMIQAAESSKWLQTGFEFPAVHSPLNERRQLNSSPRNMYPVELRPMGGGCTNISRSWEPESWNYKTQSGWKNAHGIHCACENCRFWPTRNDEHYGRKRNQNFQCRQNNQYCEYGFNYEHVNRNNNYERLRSYSVRNRRPDVRMDIGQKGGNFHENYAPWHCYANNRPKRNEHTGNYWKNTRVGYTRHYYY